LLVELFFVHLPNLHGQSGHIIGVREVIEVGNMQKETKAAPSNARNPMRRSSLHSTQSGSVSSSSSHNVPPNMKRKLAGLDRVELRMDVDLRIQEYALCFGDATTDEEQASTASNKQPTFPSCLLGGDTDSFLPWLMTAGNRLMYEKNVPFLKFSGELMFRPPTAACTSSKVVLCAESVTLVRVPPDNLDDDADVSGSSQATAQDNLELHFHDVSHIVQSHIRSHHRSQTLTALIEPND